MQIRDFTGADLEPASKLVGRSLYPSQGERSYWFGSYELMQALAEGDGTLVAEDKGTLKGICVLSGDAEHAAASDLKMHWTQQRHVLMAVTRTLGIDLGVQTADKQGPEVRAFLDGLGAACDHVRLVCCADEVDEAGWATLARSARSWLSDHGVEVKAAPKPSWTIQEGQSRDEEGIIAIIDEAAERLGHPFRTITFTVMAEGSLAGGVSCWVSDNNVHIDSLGVREDLRGLGIGTDLLRRVEEKAIELGCTTASVDTLTFQAPDYYPRHGYRELFRYRTGKDAERIFFTKSLV